MYSKNTKASSFLLFLLGLGSATKVFLFGTIAISELVIFFLAPLVFLRKFVHMKRDEFSGFIYMLSMLIGGMIISAWWNHSQFPFVFKLFAVFYGMFAYYVVFYSLLRNNLRGIGFFFLGCAISEIIIIWYFNPRADVTLTGYSYLYNDDAQDVINGQLFWIGKAREWGYLPIIMSYLKTPILYSVAAPVLFVIFALFVTISGRAQSMCVLLAGAMILLGRKRRTSMRAIGKHFWKFALLGIATLIIYKSVYSYAAGNGYLGEDARGKYERQTRQGSSVVSLLVSGRTEFFIGLLAALDKPIMGFGPRAEDTEGYAERFLVAYGTPDDIRKYFAIQQIEGASGVRLIIPTHSHILAAWVWCGIVGLIFFLWVLFRIWQHIRYYSGAIPQWFGYFALAIPTMVWSIFFNPFGSRWYLPLLMVCMNFARGVAKGRIALPYDMEQEAMRYDGGVL